MLYLLAFPKERLLRAFWLLASAVERRASSPRELYFWLPERRENRLPEDEVLLRVCSSSASFGRFICAQKIEARHQSRRPRILAVFQEAKIACRDASYYSGLPKGKSQLLALLFQPFSRRQVALTSASF